MTQQSMLARRRARGGKGLLPPNPLQWENEHNGLDLRERLGVALDVALGHEAAFDLLDGVAVTAHSAVPVAHVYVERLRLSRAWSGMCIPLSEGQAWVIYNDAHSLTRIRATLMEEYFHLHLGHVPSVLRLLPVDGERRTYRPIQEGEAYGSGAAALVPYHGLRSGIESGFGVEALAERFDVSCDLILFRAKVTKLHRRLMSDR